MSSTIVINEVSKTFGKKLVLNQISLTVESGQIYGLIGPSGSGKTTLVKIIVGMDSPSEGNVHVFDFYAPFAKHTSTL